MKRIDVGGCNAGRFISMVLPPKTVGLVVDAKDLDRIRMALKINFATLEMYASESEINAHAKLIDCIADCIMVVSECGAS